MSRRMFLFIENMVLRILPPVLLIVIIGLVITTIKFIYSIWTGNC